MLRADRDRADDGLGLGRRAQTLALLAAGLVVCALWVAVEVRSSEPLVDMTMMRIRGVWTTNLAAFLLGAGMYASFIVLPAVRAAAEAHRIRVRRLGRRLEPVPAAVALVMGLLGTVAGRVARRFGSKYALVVGTAVAALAFAWLVSPIATRTTC